MLALCVGAQGEGLPINGFGFRRVVHVPADDELCSIVEHALAFGLVVSVLSGAKFFVEVHEKILVVSPHRGR